MSIEFIEVSNNEEDGIILNRSYTKNPVDALYAAKVIRDLGKIIARNRTARVDISECLTETLNKLLKLTDEEIALYKEELKLKSNID